MLGRAGMESLWTGMWYSAILGPELRLPVGWVCLVFWGIMAVSYALPQGLERLRLSITRRRWIYLGWLAAAGLVTMRWMQAPRPLGLLELFSLPLRSLLPGSPSPMPFLHLIGVALLGLRGLSLSRGLPDIRAAAFDLQIGLVFILLYGVSVLSLDEGLNPIGLEVYLFLGLVTLGATRISTVIAYRGGKLARFGPGWAAGLALGAGLVVGLGLLVGVLSASQAGSLLARLVLGVIALLGLLFFILLLPLMDFVLRAMLGLLARMSGLLDSPFFKSLQNLMDSFNRLTDQAALRSQNLMHTLQVALPVLILLGVLGLAWTMLRLRAAWQNLGIEEQEQGSRAAGRIDLMRLARRGLGRMGLASPARLLAAARIRRIYAELLNLSARLGGQRPSHLTPLEFLPRLVNVFGGQEAGLELITAAYLRVRYGEYPESLGEVQEVEAAWKRIRIQGRVLGRKRSQLKG